MNLSKPSPTDKTYLIYLSAPQSVSETASRLKSFLFRKGVIDNPLSPGIPLLQMQREPKPPVPGLLPACDIPLRMIKNIRTEVDTVLGSWIIWPTDSYEWLKNLTVSLTETYREASISPQNKQLLPMGKGIPLARFEQKAIPINLQAEDVNSILKTIPGWRAMILSCWDIEYLSDRPWYTSALWVPIWQRRLKRAPLNST